MTQLHATIGIAASLGSIDGSTPTPQPDPDPPMSTLVPDVGSIGWARHMSDKSRAIGTGFYANFTNEERVDDPIAIAAAYRYWERTPGKKAIGHYSNELTNLEAAVVEATNQNACLSIYYYDIPDRDGVSGDGAASYAAYQARIADVIARLPAGLKVQWLVEPDALSYSLDTSTPIDGFASRQARRYACIKYILTTLTSHARHTAGDWCVLLDIGNSNWRKGPFLGPRIEICEGWRADGWMVGQANFHRRSQLHAHAADVNAQPGVTKYRPGGVPYMMESYAVDGVAQIPEANRSVSGLSGVAGSNVVTSSTPMFRDYEITAAYKPSRPLYIDGVTAAEVKDRFMVAYVSPTEVRLASPLTSTFSNRGGYIRYDGKDFTYNPAGPLCGPPVIWAPQGGHDGKPLCIGERHATSATVSNDRWSGFTHRLGPLGGANGTPGQAGRPGQAYQERILQHIVPSPHYQP